MLLPDPLIMTYSRVHSSFMTGKAHTLDYDSSKAIDFTFAKL
jgi:hypothetical protein